MMMMNWTVGPHNAQPENVGSAAPDSVTVRVCSKSSGLKQLQKASFQFIHAKQEALPRFLFEGSLPFKIFRFPSFLQAVFLTSRCRAQYKHAIVRVVCRSILHSQVAVLVGFFQEAVPSGNQTWRWKFQNL